jgi:multiple sugar transport system ATP-binding protein
MSISDRIVVMKDGVVQQIGKPQEVYDNPANLFVAKFLGNPPINVFRGSIREGKLMVGDAPILDTAAPDGEVTIAIRPEGLIPAENGPLRCPLQRVEIMGRDVSLLCSHPTSENPTVRAIVRAESIDGLSTHEIAFAPQPHKVFVFDAKSGARLTL